MLLKGPAAAGRSERIPSLAPRDRAGGAFWGSAKPAHDENKQNGRQVIILTNTGADKLRHRLIPRSKRQKKGNYLLEK